MVVNLKHTFLILYVITIILLVATCIAQVWRALYKNDNFTISSGYYRSFSAHYKECNKNIMTHSIEVDFKEKQFLMDGEPFRFIAGSLHYFRVPRQYWRDRLRKLRAAGLNAVSTCVEWSFHNPFPEQFNWEGDADLKYFLKTAAEEDLFVLLQVGPYINADRDFGGLPFWLLTLYDGNENNKINVRSTDKRYMHEINIWYANLMPKILPHFFGSGGPVILLQVENDYGSYLCDNTFKKLLRHAIKKYSTWNAVLYTADAPSNLHLNCGKIREVLSTVKFGSNVDENKAFKSLRKINPNTPLVNSEFYTGSATYWNGSFIQIPTENITRALRLLMNASASVNIHMFSGGTNFGFTSGAEYLYKEGIYNPQLTSYDYNAPLDEAGDPTPKYFAIRDVISEYAVIPEIPIQKAKPKGNYGKVSLKPMYSLFTTENILLQRSRISNHPLTFEALWLFNGLVLYETKLLESQTADLKIDGLHDRAYVYLNKNRIGILQRQYNSTIILKASKNSTLQILVENQGRISSGHKMNEYKGIIGLVTWGKLELKNWTNFGFPLDNIQNIYSTLTPNVTLSTVGPLLNGPIFYSATFDLSGNVSDTYLNTAGWTKGIIWINEYNLGRYWPVIGPQVTLFVPGVYMKKQSNTITILELEKARNDLNIHFVDKPIFKNFLK